MLTLTHHIDFPALGWSLPISDTLVQFTLFGHEFTIKWYGVLIAIGFLLAVLYALRRAPEFDLNPDHMIDAVLVCTLVGFVCARLYYVFFCADVQKYLSNPLSILYIWEGGLGIYGGIIGAFASGILMCRLRRLNTRAMFDIASLGFLIGQAIGRWGNFFNQEAFGSNTTLPWGMTGDIIASGPNGTSGYTTSDPVHPTFLYESLWCLTGFLLLHFISKRFYKFKGEIFCGYLVWYGIGRFMIESLRTDSLMIGQMRASQLVAIIAVLTGVVLFLVWRRQAISLPLQLTALEAEAAEETAEEPAADAAAAVDAPIEDEEATPAAEPTQPVAPAEPEVPAAQEADDGTDH